jgi:L-ascorbate metabolism protein UlaG (beta-lactamase superfamily)
MPTGKDLLAQMRRTTILPNSLAFWGLGQMGIAVKGPDAILYFDPCLSNVVEEQFGSWWGRAYPPPLLPAEVNNATHFLLSHEHMDHFDPETLGPAAKASPAAKFVITGWCRDLAADLDIGDDRLIVPKVMETFTLPGTTARVTAVPAAHYALDYQEDKGNRWFGFVIEWNGVVFYHSGDTLVFKDYLETMRRLPRADVAMVATNGRDYFREADVGALGNLWPAETARLAKELGWDVVIPGHNDLYPNNTIPQASLVEALAKAAPRQKFKMLQPGELYYYVK